MKKFRDYDPYQLILFPPSLQEWLPDNHPVHFINEAVEQLDLSAIYNDYQGVGGAPPYEPLMMVKILIYAMTKGIHSSRKIQQALYEDIGLRFLSCNQQPDHWTIAAFRRRHHKALGELFVQTVQMANKSGLVKLNHVAVDGTKIKANASKHSAMSYAYIQKEEKRLRQDIERILQEMERTDQAEDTQYGDRGYELPQELSTRAKRLEAIKRAKAELEAEAIVKRAQEQEKQDQEAQAKGKKRRRKKEKAVGPKPKAQRNFTDPDSRIMKSADKAFIQGYNAQASVDAETHVIVAADLTNLGADSPHLPDQIDQVKSNMGRYPTEVSADAGYCSQSNLEFLSSQNIDAFVPPDKVKHSEWRGQVLVDTPVPVEVPLKDQMRHKLITKHGRERYRLRQTSVEPVFGFIKEGLGLRQFVLRGIDKVRSMWRFTCAVHNLLKLYRAGVRFQPGKVIS